MSRKTSAKSTPDRNERLKSALKANMARRKAQARARALKEADAAGQGAEGAQAPGQRDR